MGHGGPGVVSMSPPCAPLALQDECHGRASPIPGRCRGCWLGCNLPASAGGSAAAPQALWCCCIRIPVPACCSTGQWGTCCPVCGALATATCWGQPPSPARHENAPLVPRTRPVLPPAAARGHVSIPVPNLSGSQSLQPSLPQSQPRQQAWLLRTDSHRSLLFPAGRGPCSCSQAECPEVSVALVFLQLILKPQHPPGATSLLPAPRAANSSAADAWEREEQRGFGALPARWQRQQAGKAGVQLPRDTLPTPGPHHPPHPSQGRSGAGVRGAVPPPTPQGPCPGLLQICSPGMPQVVTPQHPQES